MDKEMMIEVENLEMSYGKREVLRDISFQIKRGTIVGLLGANGAGKSTTMNILTGYLKPVQGKVYINQTDMRRAPKKAKRYIGYLPEKPPLYTDMKVLEYLMFAADLKGIPDKYGEALRVMEIVDIEDRQCEVIKKLSKGLQQRVGFAEVLLGNPPVLILDEPLVGLDPAESRAIRGLIKSLRSEHAIIISSHILSEIEELCNDILMLKDGQLVLDNSTAAAKRRGGKNVYRLIIKGDRDKISACLENCEMLRTVRYIGEKERGVYEYSGTAKNNRDIRDNILGYLVGKRFAVYGIEKQETSLEDVFIEMNGREEA
ncbi:MAG: ABC transporter ATP-binding protein [Lachnospiraceae bacterium]|nr:ABC transporter ATP-binding protein [Lachnospiraceae bacterium]